MIASYTSGSEDGSGYNITINFIGDNWTDEYQAGFTRAADYLSTVIVGDVPDVTRDFGDGRGVRTVDDLEVTATLATIDGRGGILAYAGPDQWRDDTYFPITGEMTFDFPDARGLGQDDAREDSDTWDMLVMHEMLHTTGFGTAWHAMGLVENHGSRYHPDYRFMGEHARAEYATLFPSKFARDDGSENGVAVESDLGGSGTIGSHWDEAIFDVELMTGVSDSDAAISNMSIAALDDMGYETSYVASEVVCFARGTKLTTDLCHTAVEDLSVGDQIETVDHGLQTIRWIGARALDRVDLAQYPHLMPIKIAAGCLGSGTPTHDLYVSPQHRILIASKLAKRLFDSTEILVAAKEVLALDGVEQVPVDQVEYFHILFDAHQLVTANGAIAESLYTGTQALKSLPPQSVSEIFTLFPDLRTADLPPIAARPLVTKSAQISRLLDLHAEHHLPLVNTVYH